MTCANSGSAARLFLQISSRRTTQSAAAYPPLLDILLPPAAATRFSRSGGRPSSRTLSSAAAAPGPSPQPRAAAGRLGTGLGGGVPPGPRTPTTAQSTAAAFSVTATRRATRAMYNPQKDEDGNEMMLEITPRAAKRLSEIMAKDENPRLALRIQVESGGCHGFQYLMRLVTLPHALPSLGSASSKPSSTAAEPSQPAIGEDDTIFAAVDDGSHGMLTAPKIILDRPSLELLKGSKVDFTMELIGSQFKIVDNPLATSSCGCGTSFDIKI